LKRTGATATVNFNFSARDAVERDFAESVSALGEVTEIRLG
jgi:hypothetical protein